MSKRKKEEPFPLKVYFTVDVNKPSTNNVASSFMTFCIFDALKDGDARLDVVKFQDRSGKGLVALVVGNGNKPVDHEKCREWFKEYHHLG